jgi:ketosteroid isomerase-like protein
MMVGSTGGPAVDSRIVDREHVARWIAAYEAAWRAPGADALTGIFAPDSTYLQGPYEEPVIGRPAIARMWDREREGPDEVFQLASDIIAVDGDTAVVRVEVSYGDPVTQEYRDLWLVRFAADGRCAAFEEWPFWPGESFSAGPGPG